MFFQVSYSQQNKRYLGKVTLCKEKNAPSEKATAQTRTTVLNNVQKRLQSVLSM